MHQVILVRIWDSNLNNPNPDDLVCRQVEFSAHQVNLVRTQDSVHELPDELKKSNAIIMTVQQAKGVDV